LEHRDDPTSKWVTSLLRTVASIYWFAFQTLAGAPAIVAVLDKWLGGRFSKVRREPTGPAKAVLYAIKDPTNVLKALAAWDMPSTVGSGGQIPSLSHGCIEVKLSAIVRHDTDRCTTGFKTPPI
jgi:hypothetical protein